MLALLAAILLDPLHGARSSRVSSSTALSSASNWVLLCPGRRSQSLVDRALLCLLVVAPSCSPSIRYAATSSPRLGSAPASVVPRYVELPPRPVQFAVWVEPTCTLSSTPWSSPCALRPSSPADALRNGCGV
uniref:Secreted protein n=1 Tax=Zea mays TaxID=4577 RepID=B4FND5_MAIZE|nr:unknown [Zea mays]|eukprot:NP_001140346.1 uncharacterized protein LOC100272394 precursor [Zea mays]